jgi:hypothetical protein
MTNDDFPLSIEFPSSDRLLVVDERDLHRRTAGRAARRAIETTSAVLLVYRAFRAGTAPQARFGSALGDAIDAVDELGRSLRALRTDLPSP